MPGLYDIVYVRTLIRLLLSVKCQKATSLFIGVGKIIWALFAFFMQVFSGPYVIYSVFSYKSARLIKCVKRKVIK
jgi:hypothetical protein